MTCLWIRYWTSEDFFWSVESLDFGIWDYCGFCAVSRDYFSYRVDLRFLETDEELLGSRKFEKFGVLLQCSLKCDNEVIIFWFDDEKILERETLLQIYYQVIYFKLYFYNIIHRVKN